MFELIIQFKSGRIELRKFAPMFAEQKANEFLSKYKHMIHSLMVYEKGKEIKGYVSPEYSLFLKNLANNKWGHQVVEWWKLDGKLLDKWLDFYNERAKLGQPVNTPVV